MKWQHGLMALGLAVGAWLAFFSDKTPDADVAEAIVHPPLANSSGAHSAIATSVASSNNAGKKERVIPILALVPRQALISVGHVGLDGKKLADTNPIFGPQSWVPPSPPPPDPKLFPPPPPSAPPLRFTFVGEKLEDGVWEVYLADGDKSYAVHNQSVINGTYRVDAITANAVVMTYLPLNQVQRLNLKGIQ
jgi:hypothetical protein